MTSVTIADRGHDTETAPHAQLVRERGVDSTTSSRRRPSSLAQPARNDAPGQTEDERAEPEERQLQDGRRLGQMSMPG